MEAWLQHSDNLDGGDVYYQVVVIVFWWMVVGAVVNGSRRRGNKSSATAAAAPHHCTWARWGLAELQTNPIPPTPSPSACPPTRSCTHTGTVQGGRSCASAQAALDEKFGLRRKF